MIPVTIVTLTGTTIFSTPEGLARYLNTTPFSSIQGAMPPGYKLDQDTSNLLDEDFIRRLTPELAQILFSETNAPLSAAQMGALSPRTFAALQDCFTWKQIEDLANYLDASPSGWNSGRISLLNKLFLEKLTTGSAKRLIGSNADALTALQMEALTPEAFAALQDFFTSGQIDELANNLLLDASFTGWDTGRISLLGNLFLQKLTASSAKHLIGANADTLTDLQMEALAPETFAALQDFFTSEQIDDLANNLVIDSLFTGWDTGRINLLNPSFLQKLTASSANHLIGPNGDKLTVVQMKALSPQAFATLQDFFTPGQIKDLANNLVNDAPFPGWGFDSIRLLREAFWRKVASLSVKSKEKLFGTIAQTLTADQMVALPIVAFQSLQDFFTSTQLDTIPDANILAVLNTSFPPIWWRRNIAAWLPDRIARGLVARNPDEGFLHNLWSTHIVFLRPSVFACFDSDVMKSLFGVRVTPGGTTNRRPPYLGHLLNSQIQSIPTTVLNDLIHASGSRATTSRPYQIVLSAGILNKLSAVQIQSLSQAAIEMLEPVHFKGMTAGETAVLLAGLSGQQVSAFGVPVFKMLDSEVASELGNRHGLGNFLKKVPQSEQIFLDSTFFVGAPPNLSDQQRVDLNTIGRRPSPAQLDLVRQLGPGDAPGLNPGNFFKNLENFVSEVPALFFKGLSAGQVKALSDKTLQRLRRGQVTAMGDRIMDLTDQQLKKFPKERYAAVSRKTQTDFIQRAALVQKGSWFRRIVALIRHTGSSSGRIAFLREMIPNDGDKIGASWAQSLVTYDWYNLDDVLKGKLLAVIVKEKIPLNIFSKAKLMSLDDAVVSKMLHWVGMGSLLIELQKRPDWMDIVTYFGQRDFFSIQYRSNVRQAGSRSKYDAQVFLLIGDELSQTYDAMFFGKKMDPDVPTICYRYDKSRGSLDLVKMINTTETDPGEILVGKSRVRTYLLGHGGHQDLTIGAGFDEYGEIGYIPFTEAYKITNDLWKDLSGGATGMFTKLSILGCRLAEPPVGYDVNRKEIPNKPDAWDTRFDESFLGRISRLFYQDGNNNYRATLKISAFKKDVLTGRGYTGTEQQVTPILIEQYEGNTIDKVTVSWSAAGQDIVRQLGQKLGTMHFSYNPTLEAGAINVNNLYPDTDDFQEDYLYDLTVALTDPSLVTELPGDVRGLTIVSPMRDQGDNDILMIQRNSPDGDVPASHQVLEVTARPVDGAEQMMAGNERIVRVAGGDVTGKVNAALDQLQQQRAIASKRSEKAGTTLSRPEFAGLSAQEQQLAKALVENLGGDVDMAVFNTLNASRGDVMNTLRAMVAERISDRGNPVRAAQQGFDTISTLTPENARQTLQESGLATWDAAGTVTLDENRFEDLLSDDDVVQVLKIIGALLNLKEEDSKPLMDAFRNADDPAIQQFGADIDQQRKFIAASKPSLVNEAAELGNDALNVFFVVSGIQNLAKSWSTLSPAEQGLNLTAVLGGALLPVANMLVMQSLRPSLVALAQAGETVSGSVAAAMITLSGANFALAAVSLAAVGLAWDDFWESGAGTGSYAYKALVASTVITVLSTVAMLAVGTAALVAALSTAIAATVIGTIAAAAGPIGLAIAVTALVIGGVVQGALVLEEYGDYYETVGEEVEQFFASWIGETTEATKYAAARKQASESAAAYQFVLNQDWTDSKNFLARRYGKEGYSQVFVRDRSFMVTPLTRTVGQGPEHIVATPTTGDGYYDVWGTDPI